MSSLSDDVERDSINPSAATFQANPPSLWAGAHRRVSRCQDSAVRSIEDLTDAIHSRTSRDQFREAMQAYSAGAYRAATILLWTSVMQDLTDKLRVLADSGDGAAGVTIARVDVAREAKDLRRVQEFESGLLELATTEFEFLTPREAEELRRLGNDRNLCAHPSFHTDGEDPFEMTAEQVRAYARLVVEAVLAQPPIVGKALVARFTTDMDSDSWPDEALADFLRSRYFDRARSGVMRNILEIAVKTATRPEGDNRRAGRCVAAISAATEIDEALVLEAVAAVLSKRRDHMSDADLIRTVGAIGGFKVTWAHLGSENVARVKTLLGNAQIDLLIDERAFASGPPADPDLLVSYESAVGRLNDEELERMTRRPYPKGQWVPRVLETVRTARSWRSGERAIQMVLNVHDALTLDDIGTVATEFVENNQIHHAAEVPQLFERLVERTRYISGASDVWRGALDKYTESREPDPDGEDWYSYSEARAALDR